MSEHPAATPESVEERLRRLAIAELEATRDHLTAAQAELATTKADLVALDGRLRTAHEERDALRAEAEQQATEARATAERVAGETQRQLAALHGEVDARDAQVVALTGELATATDTIARQQAHIERLKRQLARPVRAVAKKFLGHIPGRS